MSNISFHALPAGYPVENFKHAGGSYTAENALTARFLTGEVKEEPRYIDHAGAPHPSLPVPPEPMIAPVALTES
jgi:hypothetical protein